MWGPWATGMASSDSRIAARFSKAGLALLKPQAGIQYLAKAVQTADVHTLLAATIDWQKLLSTRAAVPSIFRELATPHSASAPSLQSPLLPSQHTQKDKCKGIVSSIVDAMLGLHVAEDQVSQFFLHHVTRCGLYMKLWIS